MSRFRTSSILPITDGADGLRAGTLALLIAQPIPPAAKSAMPTSPPHTPVPALAARLGLPSSTTTADLLRMVDDPRTNAVRKATIRGVLHHAISGGRVEPFAAPVPVELRGFDRALAHETRRRMARPVCFSAGMMPVSQIAEKLGLPASTTASNLLRTLVGHDSKAETFTWQDMAEAHDLPRATKDGDIYQALKDRRNSTNPLGWLDIGQLLDLAPDSTPEEILAEWKKMIAGGSDGLVTLSAGDTAVSPTGTRTGLARAIHAHHKEVQARR